MARVFLTLTFVIAMVLVASAQQQCPENQEWTDCGSACPPTCHARENQACTLQCIIGCQCKQGYVLNSAGRCVQPQNC